MLLLKCFCWLQEAASTAAAEAQSTLQAAEEAAKSADAAATEVADAAAAKAKEEYDNLRRVLDAVNAQKAELEGKLAKAGGALNAAEELKEARWADNTRVTIALTAQVLSHRLHAWQDAAALPQNKPQ